MSQAPSAVADAPSSRHGRALALLARLDLITPRSAYIARSTAAALLALGVAYLLELEMPFSAASTVLLVINPVQGAVIARCRCCSSWASAPGSGCASAP
jgi:Fusaric acid resistance protein family